MRMKEDDEEGREFVHAGRSGADAPNADRAVCRDLQRISQIVLKNLKTKKGFYFGLRGRRKRRTRRETFTCSKEKQRDLSANERRDEQLQLSNGVRSFGLLQSEAPVSLPWPSVRNPLPCPLQDTSDCITLSRIRCMLRIYTRREPRAATRVQAAFRGHLDRIRAQQVSQTRMALMRIQRLQVRWLRQMLRKKLAELNLVSLAGDISGTRDPSSRATGYGRGLADCSPQTATAQPARVCGKNSAVMH
jgi:hypothetical protein